MRRRVHNVRHILTGHRPADLHDRADHRCPCHQRKHHHQQHRRANHQHHNRTTTTLEPLAQIAADIERDLNLADQAFLDAGADPSSQQLRTKLSAYFVGDALAAANALLDGLAQDGHIVRRNADNPTRTVLTDLPTQSADPQGATVRTCRISSGIVVEPHPAGDIVLDDLIVRYNEVLEVVFVDETWRLESGYDESVTPGVSTCDL